MRSTALTSARTAGVAVVGVLLLGLTACGAPGGGGGTTPSVSTAATSSPAASPASSPAASPASSPSSPSATVGSASSSETAMLVIPPESAVTEGGTTFADFAAEHPHSDYFDVDEDVILQEKLGTGEVSLTVDTQKGVRYEILMLCPLDAEGKTDIYLSDGPEGEKDWKAGSEGMRGSWSAGLPPATTSGPKTITVTVANDRPFRVVVLVPST